MWFLLVPQCDLKADNLDSIPTYFVQQVNEKVKLINDLGVSDNSFIFFTDTHNRSNRMNSPKLIRYILNNTLINKAIWGGDAIYAYGKKEDIDSAWEKQKLFGDYILPVGKLYNLRGNHDFTIRTSNTNTTGYTYSQEETAKRIFEQVGNDVVRNVEDPDGCYYYFDDLTNKVRYIILDSTDSVKGENVSWGVVNGVGEKQLGWIIDEAISTIESGYGVIFISHIPITDTTGAQFRAFSNVLQVVDALALKTKGSVGNLNYDFTSLTDVKVLMYVSGHYHHDMQTYRNGVLHVITASDAAYEDYKRDPFVKDFSGMKKGTANEQCFDCFCIDRENEQIVSYRIGIGGDRIFHTEARVLGVGDVIRLKNNMIAVVEWKSYNSSGNVYSNNKWNLNNDIVSVDDNGNVVALKKGEAVVLALDKEGNKELFNLIIR